MDVLIPFEATHKHIKKKKRFLRFVYHSTQQRVCISTKIMSKRRDVNAMLKIKKKEILKHFHPGHFNQY